MKLMFENNLMMTRIFLAIASIFGALAVAAGAFASHALKDRLTEKALSIFETGARYQMYHALALLMVALLLSRAEASQTFIVAGGWAFVVGIAIFSGRLYALSLTGIKWFICLGLCNCRLNIVISLVSFILSIN